MPVGPPPIRPVFTHNQFYVVASFLHNIWLSFHFRCGFISCFTYVACHVTISRSLKFWREFYLRVNVLVRKTVFLTWLWLWSWLRYCDYPFSCTLSCNATNALKAKATYLHRWFLSGWNGTSWLQKMQHWYICFWNATSWDKSYRLCGMSIR